MHNSLVSSRALRSISVRRLIFLALFSVFLFSVFLSTVHAQSYEWNKAGPNQISYSKTCTHYVDGPGGQGSQGDDTNSGTSLNQAWVTIQYAVKIAPSGSTICVRGGDYTVQFGVGSSTIDLKKGSQRLTNYQSESVTIKSDKQLDPKNPYTYQPLIRLSSPQNTVENFILRDIPGIGITIYNTTGSLADNIVRNNHITNVATAGINIQPPADIPSTNIQILHNQIDHCNLDKNSQDKIYNTNNLATGAGVDCSLIQFKGIRTTTSNNPLLILGNDLSNSWTHGIIGDTNYGRSRGAIIKQNRLINRHVYIHAATDIIVDSNFFYMDSTHARGNSNCLIYNAMEVPTGEDILRNQKGTTQDLHGTGVVVTNNILYGCDASIIIRTDHTNSKIVGTIVRGNTVVINCQTESCLALTFRTGKSPFTHSKWGLLTGEAKYDSSFENVSVDSNIFYKTEPNNPKQVLVNGNSYTEGWIQKPPSGVNLTDNIWSHDPDFGINKAEVKNPKFSGMPNGDDATNGNSTNLDQVLTKLLLLADSPAIDQAGNNDLKQDFYGNTRPVGSKNDIGAHEFGSAPPTLTWDLNHDKKVNILDFSHFVFGFASVYQFPDISSFISSL